MRNRYKIYYRGYRSFIRIRGRRYYFDQIDLQTGFPYEYPAYFKVVDIDYGVDDYAIVEKLKDDKTVLHQEPLTPNWRVVPT